MNRPLPPPALMPPADRQPQRRSLLLSDGYETSIYLHRPPAGVTGRSTPVLFLHGIQSHPGWFYGTAMALARAGFAVYQVTRRGSGDNEVDRGHAESSRQLLEDVDTAAAYAAADAGGDGVHLLGVSWGGKLLAAYATWGGRGVRAASLSLVAPGIAAKVSPGLLVKCGVAFSLLFNSRRQYRIPLSDPALFTGNAHLQDYIAKDSYSLRRATAGFLFISRTLDQRIERAPDGGIGIPVTLILAADDRIIDNEGCEREVRRLAGDDIHVAVIEGAHTLEFEPDPSPLYRAVVEAALRGE